ncbi:hypothetical protein Y1Q_0022956 [Alligator mississippiensis]|uniref:Uncharacterized protein n=1 Tax=Alligator mississippiensis TaxID=8496 RepID=A0A151P777_ALLMI|nr:hypothetical protein Y1Q_0022956 [Alligator mississippiensis]
MSKSKSSPPIRGFPLIAHSGEASFSPVEIPFPGLLFPKILISMSPCSEWYLEKADADVNQDLEGAGC